MVRPPRRGLAHRESLEQNGFRHRSIVATNPSCGHLRGWMSIALMAAQFDCDVYVHRSIMPFGNFMLGSRPFVNVKSMTSLMSLGLAYGHRLEFIAIGSQADEALAGLQELLEAPSF
jgi:phosphotransferase system HPr-like phosphotransfer protein